MQSAAQTVSAYLRSLPPEKRTELEAVRHVVLENIPKGFEETMQYGMISYVVPLSRYPTTYNGQALGIVGLAAQKNYNSLYLMSVYGDRKTNDWFLTAYRASGKRLDMGKSCVRFQRASDLPLDVIGKVVRLLSVDEFLAKYEASRSQARRRPA